MAYIPVPIFMSDDCEGGLPTSAYEGDACHDVCAAETITILPRSCEGVRLGIVTAIPQGYFAKIEARSGLAKNCAISVVGGVIDSNYRGEWCALLLNSGLQPYTVKVGEKVAQVAFHKRHNIIFKRVEKESDLNNTERGKRGFGSSDSKNVEEKKVKIEEPKKDPETEEEKLNHVDPNHPLFCGSQPPPSPTLTEESEDDCQITAVSGEMKNDKRETIVKYSISQAS